jgi:hypothetical protein
MTYGILRRINGDYACVLTISDNYAAIEKWGSHLGVRRRRASVRRLTPCLMLFPTFRAASVPYTSHVHKLMRYLDFGRTESMMCQLSLR